MCLRPIKSRLRHRQTAGVQPRHLLERLHGTVGCTSKTTGCAEHQVTVCSCIPSFVVHFVILRDCPDTTCHPSKLTCHALWLYFVIHFVVASCSPGLTGHPTKLYLSYFVLLRPTGSATKTCILRQVFTTRTTDAVTRSQQVSGGRYI